MEILSFDVNDFQYELAVTSYLCEKLIIVDLTPSTLMVVYDRDDSLIRKLRNRDGDNFNIFKMLTTEKKRERNRCYLF
jgi:hypothetical protein